MEQGISSSLPPISLHMNIWPCVRSPSIHWDVSFLQIKLFRAKKLNQNFAFEKKCAKNKYFGSKTSALLRLTASFFSAMVNIKGID